jgi:hypothetical protein
LSLAIGASFDQHVRRPVGSPAAPQPSQPSPEPHSPTMPILVRGFVRPLLFAFAFIGGLRAAEPGTPATPDAAALVAEPMKIQGIFDTDLPRTERKSSVRFIFHPHFGDLTNRDYQRLPLGVRWGATEQLELSTEVETYFAHGLGHEKFASGAGFSGARAGAKYHWTEWLRPWLDTASGVNVAVPLGSPPRDVTDGLRHIAPYSTFAHRLEANPDVTVFVGVMRDFVSATSIRGRLRKNEFADDSWAITPGFVWHRGAFHYTLEAGYVTNALLDGPTRNVFVLRPAVSWDLPKSLTFNSKGRWVFGLGLRATHGPDGNDFGVSGKFRGEFNFKRMLGLGSAGGPKSLALGKN